MAYGEPGALGSARLPIKANQSGKNHSLSTRSYTEEIFFFENHMQELRSTEYMIELQLKNVNI